MCRKARTRWVGVAGKIENACVRPARTLPAGYGLLYMFNQGNLKMEKSENVNTRKPLHSSLFWLCFVLFVIPIIFRFKSIYCSNIIALIAIFIPSFYNGYLPELYNWSLKTKPESETA